VGSKSKIPRCDLQRLVLVEDNKPEFGTNRSHSSITKDGSNSGTCGNREKKSTSAPLLSLKNQINPDRMSDLMEIDFSQATNLEKQKFIKNNEIPKHIENVFPKSIRNDSSSLALNATSQKDIFNGTKISNTTSSATEDGYLEMKPVGNAYTPSTTPSTTCLSSSINMITLADLYVKRATLDANKISTYNIPRERLEPSISEEKKSNSPVNEQPKSPEPSTVESNSNIDIALETLTVQSDKPINVEEKLIENNNLDTGCHEEKKLVHSISSEDYTQTKDKSNDFAKINEAGYKILQIKSDSSLFSSKPGQKGIAKDNLLAESANTIADHGSISVTKFNITPKATDSKVADPSKQQNILQIKDLNFPSRSFSRISQTELHYATLDLPHCSGQNPGTYLKRGSRESPPVSACPEVGNSYAKIDFDQSDSSSSSSNIFNT